MKKHLLGLAIFSFIVVSFAVAFASFYAPMESCPIRQIEEVRQPVLETDKKNKCNKQAVRFEVISSQFDWDSKKLISQIKIKLDGLSNVPDSVLVGTFLYSEQQLNVKEFTVNNQRVKTFQLRKDTNELVFEVVSDVRKSRKLNSKENLYVTFWIEGTHQNSLEFKGVNNKSNPVLLVHSKDSILKK